MKSSSSARSASGSSTHHYTPHGFRSGPSRDPARRRKRRVLYFAFSSAWGFLVGTSIMFATAVPGLTHGGPSIFALIAAATLALIGGAVIAVVYRHGASP